MEKGEAEKAVKTAPETKDSFDETTEQSTPQQSPSPSSSKKKRDNKHGHSQQRPRKRRDRKKGLRENHLLQNVEYKIHIEPLALNGVDVPSVNGWLRTVEPYPHTHATHAKARWIGRTILDVYSTEFGSYPKSYYEIAIKQGRILVSNQKVDIDYIVQGQDVLSHTIHRHEPAVAAASKEEPVRVLQVTDDVVVVDKPSTVPVHPCGGYNKNSLTNILEASYGKVYNVHRLDRLTSGLIILSKSSKMAAELGKNVKDRSCEKIYLARVKGKFPLNCPEFIPRLDSGDVPVNGEWENLGCVEEESSKANNGDPNKDVEQSSATMRQRNAHAYWVGDAQGSTIHNRKTSLKDVFDNKHSEEEWIKSLDSDQQAHESPGGSSSPEKMQWFHLACPTRVLNHKDGVCEAGLFDDLDDASYVKAAKAAQTAFAVVRYDEETDSTVVLCHPFTGRTHQIRLHLQYLRHSIANDPNYGGDMWYGNPKGEEACRKAHATLNELNTANENDGGGEEEFSKTIDLPATEQEIKEGIADISKTEEESIFDFIKRTCVWCARSRIGGADRNALEFLIRSPGIWLHAFRYKFKGLDGGTQCYSTPVPSWCLRVPEEVSEVVEND